MQKDLHEFRKKIDSCIKEAQNYKAPYSVPTKISDEQELDKMQREISLVITKLQEAKMWAGKCLEAIGSPFPKELRDEAELNK